MRKKIFFSAFLVAMALVITACGGSSDNVAGKATESLPSSKAAVAMGDLIDLGALASTDGSSTDDTGYVTVMQTFIKAPSGKELSADVSVQCGLVTETVTKGKGGKKDSSEASGEIQVRVKGTNTETGEVRYFKPSEAGTAADGGPVGVTYCSRVQQLESEFAGLECTANLTTGEVTCAEEESLGLLLETLNANAFNYLLVDTDSGVWKVEVQARAHSDVQLGGSELGSAEAEAFIGLGSTRIETLRLVKDMDTGSIVELE